MSAYVAPSELAEIVTVEGDEPPTLAPRSIDEAVSGVRSLADVGATALITGSESTLKALPRHTVDAQFSSSAYSGIVDYQPDDLTVIVRAGTTIADLDDVLSNERQTAVLPEMEPLRTVGGVVASGTSGYRRLRYGPTRDRVLGVTLVTGYGERITAGGALVKNVTGYDLARLCAGSHGTLGFVADICLKLWPQQPVSSTIEVADAEEALALAFRPLAVLETPDGVSVMVEGSQASVEAAQHVLRGVPREGLAWPVSPSSDVVLSVRVPASATATATGIVRDLHPEHFVAQHGVGLIEVGLSSFSADDLHMLRTQVRELGGVVVVTRWIGMEAMPDRWGTTPDGLSISSRLTSLFDPSGVFRVGQLPGGL